MSTAPRYIPSYTIHDYQLWEGDWELIDGVPIAMTPSPFGHHERIVSRLSFEIQAQLRQNNCPCEVYTNLDWIVNRNTIIRPDLMVVCGDQPVRHLERPPALMVEVLSDATRTTDLEAKRTIAAENHVRNYLIIDPDQRHLRQAAERGWGTLPHTEPISVQPDDRCSVAINVSHLFDA